MIRVEAVELHLVSVSASRHARVSPLFPGVCCNEFRTLTHNDRRSSWTLILGQSRDEVAEPVHVAGVGLNTVCTDEPPLYRGCISFKQALTCLMAGSKLDSDHAVIPQELIEEQGLFLAVTEPVSEAFNEATNGFIKHAAVAHVLPPTTGVTTRHTQTVDCAESHDTKTPPAITDRFDDELVVVSTHPHERVSLVTRHNSPRSLVQRLQSSHRTAIQHVLKVFKLGGPVLAKIIEQGFDGLMRDR